MKLFGVVLETSAQLCGRHPHCLTDLRSGSAASGPSCCSRTSRLLALLLLLAGCGSAPLHPHVLEGPEAYDRWEPSGAVALGDRLWVVTDRGGWIAAYDLPLKTGQNRPVATHALKPGLKRIKWEDAAPDGQGGLLLLEAYSRTVWRCAAPDAGCPDLRQIEMDASTARLDEIVAEPARYMGLEALAAQGLDVWLGTRGAVYQARLDEGLQPWSVLVDQDGRRAWKGDALLHEGRSYGLSGMALDGDTLWMTWSFEVHDDDRPSGVSGLLARAELNEHGLPGAPQICRALAGKPEGIAVWGGKLIVVFDQDRDRKGGGSDRFALEATEDFARTLPKQCR